MWPLNHWIMEKISRHLNKEGCSNQELEATKLGVKMTFRDSFGYVYELNIKTIGRIDTREDEVAKYDRTISKNFK